MCRSAFLLRVAEALPVHPSGQLLHLGGGVVVADVLPTLELSDVAVEMLLAHLVVGAGVPVCPRLSIDQNDSIPLV